MSRTEDPEALFDQQCCSYLLAAIADVPEAARFAECGKAVPYGSDDHRSRRVHEHYILTDGARAISANKAILCAYRVLSLLLEICRHARKRHGVVTQAAQKWKYISP